MQTTRDYSIKEHNQQSKFSRFEKFEASSTASIPSSSGFETPFSGTQKEPDATEKKAMTSQTYSFFLDFMKENTLAKETVVSEGTKGSSKMDIANETLPSNSSSRLILNPKRRLRVMPANYPVSFQLPQYTLN